MKERFPRQCGSIWTWNIRRIIQTHIENKRRYNARIRWEKEKAAILANDSDAEIPCKKRGRPVDPNSLRRRMAELRQDYENAEAGSKGEVEGSDVEGFGNTDEWQ